MRDANQPQEKFTVLDAAIARDREKIDDLGVQVRWVEHQSMVVNSLTKVRGNTMLLESFCPRQLLFGWGLGRTSNLKILEDRPLCWRE